jgi:hypothetical protein
LIKSPVVSPVAIGWSGAACRQEAMLLLLLLLLLCFPIHLVWPKGRTAPGQARVDRKARPAPWAQEVQALWQGLAVGLEPLPNHGLVQLPIGVVSQGLLHGSSLCRPGKG